MAAERSIANSFFMIDIGGTPQGYCKKVSGGKYTGDIAESKVGSDLITKKMLSNHKVGEFSADIGIAMGKQLNDWIMQSFTKAHTYVDGAIAIGDADYNEMRRIEFQQALITEFGTPKLDAAGKEAGYLTLKFQPESMSYNPGGGAKLSANLGTKQKQWMAHNFRIEIGGLDCTTMQSVDAFSWKQKTVVDQYGHLKTNALIPTGLECGDLKVTFGAGAKGKVEDAWCKAAHKWFIEGASREEDEMHGRLVFLAQNMNDELGAIEFKNLGFKEFSTADLERGEKARSCTATFYCEQAVWQPKATDH